MTNEEAKFILRAYRLGGQDASDPQFQEALEHLKRDPELARWFSEEQKLDSRLQAKILEASSVPPGLKTNLLALQKIIRPSPWWKRPAWVAAAAASMALLLTAAALWFGPLSREGFSDFHSFVASIAAGKFERLDLNTRDLVEVRQWLQNRSAPADFLLPPGLNGMPSLGCRVLDWNGRKVSFVCFELENNQMAHLFVIDRTALRGAPAIDKPAVATAAGGVTTASWSDARRVYVLASLHDARELRPLL